MNVRIVTMAVACILVVASCTSSTGTESQASGDSTTSLESPSVADLSVPSTTTDTTLASSTTTSSTTPSFTTTSSATTSSTTTSSTTTSSTTTSSTSTTTVPTTTGYVIPLVNARSGGWGDTHSSYPATDLFENGCGNGIVSPVNGTLLEVRRINSYDANVDNPATRGGRSISILGDDGVRYYLAHFELIDEALVVGARVSAGQYLGTIGTTGRSSACHLHFGVSPPCPDQEWSVRRGVVWPYRYLNDWREGGQLSPADEVAAWVAANPDACAAAAADPFAADA